jgi:probable rRNA maturation factor
MIDMDNQTDFTPDLETVQRLMEALGAGDIERVICDDDAIRELNREHRGIDRPTDVLSFPYEPMPMAPIGSVVVSADHVREGARKFGHTEADEFALLFLHGLLHLLGYDHETDDGRMRHREKELIEAFGLPRSLIVRTEEEA